jgi:hypothetical protein
MGMVLEFFSSSLPLPSGINPFFLGVELSYGENRIPSFFNLSLTPSPAVVMGIILRMTSYLIMFLCLTLIGLINLNYFYFFEKKLWFSA